MSGLRPRACVKEPSERKNKKRVDKKSRKAEKGKKSKPEKEVDRLGSIQGADSSFSQVADYLHLKMEVPQRKDLYLGP